MKKTEEVNYWVCDFCGKRCQSTPEYIMPQIELQPVCECYGGWIVAPKQMDICVECEDKIGNMLYKFQKERMVNGQVLSGKPTVHIGAAEKN